MTVSKKIQFWSRYLLASHVLLVAGHHELHLRTTLLPRSADGECTMRAALLRMQYHQMEDRAAQHTTLEGAHRAQRQCLRHLRRNTHIATGKRLKGPAHAFMAASSLEIVPNQYFCPVVLTINPVLPYCCQLLHRFSARFLLLSAVQYAEQEMQS